MKNIRTENIHPFFFRVQAPYTDTNRFVLHLRDACGSDDSGEFTMSSQRIVPGAGMTWTQFLEGYIQDDVTEDQFKAFGQDLFHMIIGESGLGAVWSGIEAASQNLPLQMTVEFSRNTEAMAELPLELLHDSVNFVFARPGTGIERTLLGTPARAFKIPPTPKVLFAWACPPDSGDHFDPSPHTHVLKDIFKDQMRTLENATLSMIEASLQSGRFDYLHIMAHGYRDLQNAGICLNGKHGGIDYVAAQRLANGVHGYGLKLVFLCSCQTAVAKDKAFSGVGQQLLAKEGGDIPCVVATQANLPVRDSEILVERFYRLLAETRNPSQALARARRDAFDKGRSAWSVPVLLTRPKDEVAKAVPTVNTGLPTRKPTYQPRELEHEGLQALTQSRLISLVGLPGIGKTECGKEIARIAWSQSLFDRVIYREVLPGYTVGQVRVLLGTALNQTGVKEDSELAALLSACDQRILLLIDNAEDLMKLPPEEQAFRTMVDTLLGYTSNTSILLTTRWLLGGTQISECELDVPPMSLQQTGKLLEAELRQRGVFKPQWPNTSAWREIQKIIDGHPRSLWLISGHFDRRRGTPDYVLAKLRQYREEAILESGLLGRTDLLDILKEDQKQRLRSLVASMNFSFEVLQERHPDAAQVYIGLSLFPSGLPDKVAQEVAGGASSLALDHLYRYHLVAWHNDRTFYPVPLHWYAERLRKSSDINEASYIIRAINAFEDYITVCDGQITNGAIVAGVDAILAEEANLLNLAQWTQAHGKEASEYSRLAGIAASAGNALKTADRHDTFQLLVHQGLALAKITKDAYGEANCLKALGDLNLRLADLDGAQKAYDAALPIYREIRARMGEANCLQSMGLLMLANKSYDQAFQQFGKVLELHIKIENALGQQAALGYLARTAYAAGASEQALVLSEDSLNLGRHINDRYGQTITLQLQLEILQSLEMEMPVLAIVILLRNLYLEISNKEGAAQYEEISAQVKKNMPAAEFTELEQNVEAIRADAINKVREYYDQNNKQATESD